MKKSLLIALGAGALGFFAYRKGLISGVIDRLRSAAPELQPGMEEKAGEQEAEPRARRRTKGMRSRRPSHFNAEGLLDLNSASAEELQNLRGIGPVLAERIIENRPYVSKIDLVGRMVIPDATYEVIKHEVIVRAAA